MNKSGIFPDFTNRKVLINIKSLGKHEKQGAINALHKIGNSLKRTAKRGIYSKKDKTGRVYLVRLGGRIKRHQASAGGQYPANLTGTLAKSVGFEKANTGMQLEFGAGNKETGEAIYAKYLEEGTSKMSPRPFLTKAVKSNLGQMELYLQQEIGKQLKKL